MEININIKHGKWKWKILNYIPEVENNESIKKLLGILD